MTSQQFNSALRVSVSAAMKAGLSLPDIIGNLELAKINVERLAYQHALAQLPANLARVERLTPPGETPGQ